MNIVFCLDKNIIKSLKAIITSINHHTKRKVSYYIICPKQDFEIFNNFNKEYKLNINIGKFEVTDRINKLIKKCSYYNGSKIANYSRFFIKKVFPDLKKIIYLDTDMLVLDDIGKLWDSVEFNQDNFFAAPKYIWFHKLFYIKRLEYYYSYFNNSNFFNGGVFLTDLTYWNDKLYQKLYQITFELIDNCVTHTFTEPILNCMFPNFIQLDPSWNCSGYGNNKLYPLLKLRDYNIKPKIIHWSGHMKPWHKLNVHMEKLWNYYLNEPLQFIYLLYYDDNPSNKKSNILLNSISNISFNLKSHNVYQYEKYLKLDPTIGRNIKRHYCVKYFIENTGYLNYYLFSDAYDVYFIKFDHKIIDYMEENNIKILYQNNTCGFKGVDCLENNICNYYKKDLVGNSFGVNGGFFIGKGYNIVNFYDEELFKNIRKFDDSDENLISRCKNISSYIKIDHKNFSYNTENMRINLKFFGQKLCDIKSLINLNSNLCLIHFNCTGGRILMPQFKNFLQNNNIEDMQCSKFRYIVFYLYFLLSPFVISLFKIILVLVNSISNFLPKYSNKEK